MNDGVIGSDGGMVVSGPKGSIQLNKDDSIVAGTNLGGGSGGEKFDYNKMASAMSQVQINTSIRHDSFGAKNQSANHGSYQSDAKHQTRFA
jgi:N-methylhydantoinase B/oxoprolinase/acetone carboxylase alpha subunit